MSEAKGTGTFDEIWTFIEEKFEEVPAYIKYILSYCGFNNGTSIATIEDEDIIHFVSEVRNGNVTDYYKEINKETNVLEGSAKSIENFEFRRGHLKHLMTIVKFLKNHAEENGPDCFTSSKQKKISKAKKADRNVSKVPRKTINYSHKNKTLAVASGMEEDIEKHTNILIQKMLGSLTTHTKELYEVNVNKVKGRISSGELIQVGGKLDDTNLESETIESSKESVKASKCAGFIICPYCSTKTTVFHLSGFRWNSSNFDRHLTLYCPETVKTKIEDKSDVDDETTNDESLGAAIINSVTTITTSTNAENGEVVNDKQKTEKGSSAVTNQVVANGNKYAKTNLIDVSEVIEIDYYVSDRTSAPDKSDVDAETTNGETLGAEIINSEATTTNAKTTTRNVDAKQKIEKCSDATTTQVAVDAKIYFIDVAEVIDHDSIDNGPASTPFCEKSKTIDSDYAEVGETPGENQARSYESNENLGAMLNNTPASKTNGQQHSSNNPKAGDYVICSTNESSIKWPGTVSEVKYFVAHVLQVNDTSGEFELKLLKKNRYSKFVFEFPEKDDIRFITSKEILKILEIPPRKLRHSLVFKDKSLLEYNFII